MARTYFERWIPVIPLFTFLCFLYCNAMKQDTPYEDISGLVFLNTVLVMCSLLWYMLAGLKKEREYSFVGSLPVTKRQQIRVIILELALCAVVLVVITEGMILYYTDTEFLFWEVFTGVAVKCVSLLLLCIVVFWLFSHRVPDLTGYVLFALLAILEKVSLERVLKMGQVLFGYEGNHLNQAWQNVWNVMTVPISRYEMYRYMPESRFIPDFSITQKLELTGIYVSVSVVITVLIYRQGERNYARGDFGRNYHIPYQKKGYVLLITGLCILGTAGVGSMLLEYDVSYFGSGGRAQIQQEEMDREELGEYSGNLEEYQRKYMARSREKIEAKTILKTDSYRGIRLICDSPLWKYEYYRVEADWSARIFFLILVLAGGGLSCGVCLWKMGRGGVEREKLGVL